MAKLDLAVFPDFFCGLQPICVAFRFAQRISVAHTAVQPNHVQLGTATHANATATQKMQRLQLATDTNATHFSQCTRKNCIMPCAGTTAISGRSVSAKVLLFILKRKK
uniref:Secreted protein n=1 Tax=Panagrellus redivivus TaxID=6233 RepID=A0A7E4V550_PANRE